MGVVSSGSLVFVKENFREIITFGLNLHLNYSLNSLHTSQISTYTCQTDKTVKTDKKQ